mmetsp:Transcript_10898/g.45384  ORF Transcript_10898/g.45384 Transcript_10898/m.45384 type:complete len:282 (-) Transcript_10898:267-1112(-)
MFLHAVSVVSRAVRIPETVPPSEPPSLRKTSSSLGGGGDAGAPPPPPPPGRNAAKSIPRGPPGDSGAAAAGGGGGADAFVSGLAFVSRASRRFGFVSGGARPRSTLTSATRPSRIPPPSPTPPLFARSRSALALAIAAASVFSPKSRACSEDAPSAGSTNSVSASSAADLSASRSNARLDPIPVAAWTYLLRSRDCLVALDTCVDVLLDTGDAAGEGAGDSCTSIVGGGIDRRSSVESCKPPGGLTTTSGSGSVGGGRSSSMTSSASDSSFADPRSVSQSD